MEKVIKTARTLAIHHKYDEALELLESTFGIYPKNIDVLILTGNILELKAAQLARLLSRNKKHINKLRQMAKNRYLDALKIAPDNPAINIDLGDWYANYNKKKALEHYENAINLLEDGKFYVSLKDELIDALEGKKVCGKIAARKNKKLKEK